MLIRNGRRGLLPAAAVTVAVVVASGAAVAVQEAARDRLHQLPAADHPVREPQVFHTQEQTFRSSR